MAPTGLSKTTWEGHTLEVEIRSYHSVASSCIFIQSGKLPRRLRKPISIAHLRGMNKIRRLLLDFESNEHMWTDIGHLADDCAPSWIDPAFDIEDEVDWPDNGVDYYEIFARAVGGECSKSRISWCRSRASARGRSWY